MQFHYTGQGRLPQAVTMQDQSGATSYLLGYDQVGSLKAAAAMDGEHEGRVVKVVDYDAFGAILADSNPALFMPLAFAGGLRDRFTGLVRFCHRDYDPTVGRFTAPDPLGDTGGDHDLYDYCVDEPVGRVDPKGLAATGAADSCGFFSGIGDWFGDIAKKVGGMFSPDEASAATGNQTADMGQVVSQATAAGQATGNSTKTPLAGAASSQSNATPSADTGKYAIFDKKKGTLEVHDGQGANTWNATSGPFGKGALPEGNYTIGGNIPKKSTDTSFCDKDGNCFSVVIDPNFTTERDLLRIHPNRSGRGTEGCIGVKDSNTKSLFNSLKKMRGRQVEVR